MSEEMRLTVTDDAIERMLLARASGSGTTPDDVAHAVMAEVARTRQRSPGLALPRPSGWGRRETALVLIAALLTLASLAALAVGAGLLRSDDHRPTATTLGVDVSPAPSGEPVPAPLPVQFGELPFGVDGCCHLTVASSSVAWLSADGGSTARRYRPLLFRTTDDGHTWLKLNLPRGNAFATIRPVDADTVYLAYDDQAPTAIAVTHDGGATWIQRAVDVRASTLWMQSSLAGFATGGNAGRSFETTDGGQTWTNGGITTNPPGGIVGAFSKDGLLRMAWNGQQDNVPFDDRLWLTTNGARTWRQRSFPVDETAKRGWAKDVRAGRIDGGRIVIFISTDDGNGTSLEAAYASVDDGRSWQLIRTFSESRASSVDLLSATTWIVDNWPLGFESTTDGGASWHVTDRRPDTSPDVLDDQSIFDTIDHGWSIHWCGGHPFASETPPPDVLCNVTGERVVILETTDGGASWSPIGG